MFMTESWLKNEEEERKRAAKEAVRKEDIKKREEESEGLRLTGSQKDQQITEQIDSSRGPRLEKVHQRPSWSLFIKCS